MTLVPPKTKKVTSLSAICIFKKNCLQSVLQGFVTAGVVNEVVSIVVVLCVSDELFAVVAGGDTVDMVDSVTTWRTETIGELLLTPSKSHFIWYKTAQKQMYQMCCVYIVSTRKKVENIGLIKYIMFCFFVNSTVPLQSNPLRDKIHIVL